MSHINLDLQASHKMLMLLDEANVNTELIIDSIPGIFLIVNENHEVLRANLEFIKLLGLDSEDILRLPLSRLFNKESWKIFAHNIKQIVESETAGASIRFEMGLAVGGAADPGERTFHWTLTGRSVKNQGEGRLVTVFGDDISEMRETERRLLRVFTSIPLGIFTMNRDGTVGDSYSSYLESLLDCGKLAGTAVDDVLFKPALASMAPDSIEGIAALRECLGKSVLEFGAFARTFPQEIFHKTDARDGRWLKITYQPIVFDRIVEQILIILEDRTAIVNAEKEMLDAALDREKAVALEKLSLAMYENAIRDPLTGLYTRLYMKDAVAALVWSHDHQEIPKLSVAIFDIDHFKSVNDNHGHKNGDLILSEVAGVILRHVREQDIPIRLGGEEFVVFMAASHDTARRLAEQVRLNVEALRVDLGDAVVELTISAGIATHRKGETLDDFLHLADQFLYRAKANGRNQTLPESAGIEQEFFDETHPE